jgi:protein ImuA
LSLVAGGAVSARFETCAPAKAGAQTGFLLSQEYWRLPRPEQPTLSELFAAHPRDGGWAGFLLAQLRPDKPLLWVQDRMAILESGRVHPPGLPTQDLIHVEARDARDALWAMEEGLRCSGLSAVVGEIWGDPKALDFTATRRLAVASERSGVAAFLIRLGGHANLSGARMRWRIASAPSLANDLDPKAPGLPAWDAELFRARGSPPGRWSIAHEADRFHLVAASGDRALGEERRLSA